MIDETALQDVYKQLNEAIGTEQMEKVWRLFSGMQVTFPAHLYNRQLAANQIRRQFDGHNLDLLARQYQYSQKWAQSVIHSL